MSDSLEQWLDSQLAMTLPTATVVEEPQAVSPAAIQEDDTVSTSDVTAAPGFIDLSCFADKTYMATPTETLAETPQPTASIDSTVFVEPVQFQENMYLIEGQLYVPLKDVLDTVMECQQLLKKHISWMGNQDKRMTWIRRDVNAAGGKLHQVYGMLRQNYYPKKQPHPANRK